MKNLFCVALLFGVLFRCAQAQEDASFDIGVGYVNFLNSNSSFEEYYYMQNQSVDLLIGGSAKKFTNYHHGYCWDLRLSYKNGKRFGVDFGITHRIMRSNGSGVYPVDPFTFDTYEIKTKLYMNSFNLGLSYYATQKLELGASMDLGIYSSRIKYTGAGYNTKWDKWYKGSPVVGGTLFLQCNFAKYIFARIYKQWGMFGLNVDLTGSQAVINNAGFLIGFRFSGE